MNALSSHCDGRVIHDADSHIIESVGFMEGFASKYVQENLDPPFVDFSKVEGVEMFFEQAKKRLRGDDPELTEQLKANVLGDPAKFNMWAAYGAVDKVERRDSLDLIGVSSQLVFPGLVFASRFARSKDLEVVYGGTEAQNRGMVEFCSSDPSRLLPVGYLSMRDPVRSLATVKQSIKEGIKAFWIHTDAVEGRAPSHIDYDPIWAVMQEAGIPIALHIGSGNRIPDAYSNTGVERELVGKTLNVETTSPKDVTVLHHSIERWMGCMIYDGVLERFPNLKIGLVELGANWLPACMANLDMGAKELGKFDQGLKKLSLKPSEYVQRQVRATPFHFEDAGWILRNVGKDILMFNTDYPHPEGGKDPFGDFQRSLDAVGATTAELDAFYSQNFEYLMGM